MEYKLVVVSGDAKRKVIKISPPIIIGRSRDADVPVGHPLVSRRHCEITVSEEGTLIVEDLGSLNGTYHGEQRITEPVYLEPGDTLTVGSITFQAQYGDFQPEDEPPFVPTPKMTAGKPSPSASEDDDLPDFLSAGADDEEDAEEEAEADDDGFPDFEAAAPKQPDPPAKKRRPPPSAAPEPEEEEEELVEPLDEIEEALADDDEEAEIEEIAEFDAAPDEDEPDELGESNIAVGQDEHADVEEEEVEVAAGDSRTGESGSDLNWLTGDGDEEGEGSGKGGDSGLDSFFKSL